MRSYDEAIYKMTCSVHASISVLLHRDQRRDVATANWTGLLGLNKFLTTALTDAEVAAWHYKGVLGVAQADEALRLGVIVDDLLTLLCSVFIRHTVD